MMMQRLRDLASRKRRSKATPSLPYSTSSTGHTLVKHAASLDPSLNLPSSIHSSSETDQDVVGVTSQTRSMSTQTDVKPSQANKSTQTQTQTEINIEARLDSYLRMNNENAGPKKLAAKSSNKKAAAKEHCLTLDSDLLAMVDTLIADSNAIHCSGLAVSQCLNDTARDILEANTNINQIGSETTQLTNQMEMMQLRFNSAYVQFSNARSLHRTIIDHRSVATRHEVVLAEMLHSLQEIEKMIEDEEGQAYQWPIDRLHEILSVCPSTPQLFHMCIIGCHVLILSLAQRINELHTNNKYLYDFKVIEENICRIMIQFRMVDFDQKYHHLLLVGMDPMDFFNEMDQEARSFAKSHKAPAPTSTDLPELDKDHDRGSQSKILMKRDQKENLSVDQLHFLQYTSPIKEPGRIDPDIKSFAKWENVPLQRPSLQFHTGYGSPNPESFANRENAPLIHLTVQSQPCCGSPASEHRT